MAKTSMMIITPLTNLFLVLWVVVMIPLHEPHGIDVVVPNVSHECGDSRTVVIRLSADRRLMINLDEITSDKLGVELAKTFRTRYERIVFVEASPDIEFADLVRVVDIAIGSIEGMRVGVITPALRSGTIRGMDNCLVVRAAPPGLSF